MLIGGTDGYMTEIYYKRIDEILDALIVLAVETNRSLDDIIHETRRKMSRDETDKVSSRPM